MQKDPSKLTKPFLVRALSVFLAIEIELGMVDRRRIPKCPLGTNMSAENIITDLMATPRNARTHRIKANMEQIINKNGLREYQRAFRDGSLIGTKIG
jgi:hypothetical protein